jgi:polynucleotide 5'-hydroxyl-kinase GRC3/NOL9
MALVDIDIGQSTVSPPGTIGLASIADNKISSAPEKMYFVGSVTPTGFMLSFITGTKKILDYTLAQDYSLIAIDTTGLVYGGAAKELKFREIDIISPKHIVAIQKNQELESILAPQEKRSDIHIWRLKTPEETKIRSMEERQQCRKENFQNYFKNKKTFSISLKNVAAIGIIPDLGGKAVSLKELNIARLERIRTMKNCLIGINDGHNFTLAVGIISDVDLRKEEIIFESPDFNIKDARIIQFSPLKLDSI